MLAKVKRLLKALGPGLVTGAADDDPSGIATYSQTGAQFGYGQLWTALFIFPFMTAVQGACAKIGAVTGQGIAATIKTHYSSRVLYGMVALILIANTINIGADLGAMAAAANLIVPVSFTTLTLLFTATILILEVFLSYRVYANILKWLVLMLLAYPISLLLVHQPWPEIIRATFIPHLEFTPAFLFIITGVFGTTISPYMFFWQASQEVEEEKLQKIPFINGKPQLPPKFIRNLRIDTIIGMIFSQVTSWSIIVVAGTVFFTHHITNIETAADAARALEPLVQGFAHAGFLSKLIFAIGVVGLGFLAIPVLSGSTAYAVSEAFNWKHGLNLKLKQAPGFYGVIIVATLLGLLINFVGISPIKALIFTAVFNAIASIPLLFLIAKIAGNKKIMGSNISGPVTRFLLWLTFSFTTLTALALLVSSVWKR